MSIQEEQIRPTSRGRCRIRPESVNNSASRKHRSAASLLFVVVLLLFSTVPLGSGSGEAVDGYVGDKHTVVYHPYVVGNEPSINESYNDYAEYPDMEVEYLGSVVSTEYNPQFWSGIESTGGSSVLSDVGGLSKWYGIKSYEKNRTLVFTGWVYKNSDGFTEAQYPGDVMTKDQIDAAKDSEGKIHIYATWGVLQNYSKGTQKPQWSGGSVYQNVLDLNGGSFTQSSADGGYTIRNGTISVNGSGISFSGPMIIDSVRISGNRGGGNHGVGNAGLFAQGNVLIIGSGVSGTSGGKSQADFAQVFGGNPNSGCSDTKLIIHSGVFSNVSGGSRTGSSGNTCTIVKDVTIYDTLCGGGPQAGVSGSTYVYATALNMPGDTYEERRLGTSDIGSGVVLTESTILTGGCNQATVTGDTHVYISGTSKVWDVQGAGRGGDSKVSGTANVEVSGSALVKHALCGSITDGLWDKKYIDKALGGRECVKNTVLTITDSSSVCAVFGAGYDTFYKARYPSMLNGGTISVTLEGNCTVGYVYGGGYRGTVGTPAHPIGSVTVNISGGIVLNDVFGGGRGGLDKMCHNADGSYYWSESYDDTTGFSSVYAKTVIVKVSSGAVVRGSVYGGGESVPAISGYDGIGTSWQLGGNDKYKNSSESKTLQPVATVVSDIEVVVEGRVDGSVFGAGKGVDYSEMYDGRHASAYIFAMDSESKVHRIPWMAGSSTSEDIGTPFVQIGNPHELFAPTKGNVAVVVSSASIGGSVYGGGELGVLSGDSVSVSVGRNESRSESALIEGSVFGGGKGSESSSDAGLVSSKVKVEIGACIVRGSVYGGGELARTEGAIEVVINGAEINSNVYGGGLGRAGVQSTNSKRKITLSYGGVYGSVYGSSSLGDDSGDSEVVLCGEDPSFVYGSVYGGGFKGITGGSTSISISGRSLVYHSIYGGGDVGEIGSDSTVFDKVLVTGDSTINASGGGVFIGRSVFGSGNSCKVGGMATVVLSGLGVSGAPLEMESLQNAKELVLESSVIELSGRSDASSAQASEKYSLNNIGRLVLKSGASNGTDITLKAHAAGIGSYSSVDSDGKPTSQSSPRNTIEMEGGHILKIGADSGSGYAYGTVEGYTQLRLDVSSEYHGAFAYGSAASSGGFIVIDEGHHQLASTTDFDDPACRCWYILGTATYAATMVADGRTDGSGDPFKEESVDIPVVSRSSFIIFTGFSYTIHYADAFQLVESCDPALQQYSLRLGGSGTGFSDGIVLTHSLKSVDPKDMHSYCMQVKTGLPSLSLKLSTPLNPIYTGLLASLTIHLWEASPDGTYGYTPTNKIDIRVDIYSEATDFPNKDGYDVVLELTGGTGSTRFQFNRSFYGYKATIASISQNEGFEGVFMAPDLNSVGTLGWTTPLGAAVELSRAVNGQALGELTGSFEASLRFYAEGLNVMPSKTALMVVSLDNGISTEYVTLRITVKAAEAHTVTFVNMDEGLTREIRTVVSVYHGSTVSNAQKPQTWNHFVGWYSDVYRSNIYDFGSPVTRDIVVYSLYCYVVTFDNGDGTRSTANASIGPDGTGTVRKPADPVRDHYAFRGWVDALGKERFSNGSETVSSDTTFFAVWTGHPVQVVLKDGNLSITASAEYGRTYSELKFTYNGAEYTGLDAATGIVKESHPNERFVRWMYSSGSIAIGVFGDMTTVSAEDHVLSAEFTSDAILVKLESKPPEDRHLYGYTDEAVTVQAPSDMVVFAQGEGGSKRYSFSPGNAYFQGYSLRCWSYSIGGTGYTAASSVEVSITAEQADSLQKDESGARVLVLEPVWDHLEYQFVIEAPIGGSILAYRITNEAYKLLDSGSRLYHGDRVRLEYVGAGGYTLSSWGFSGGASFIGGSASNPTEIRVTGDCVVHARLGGMYEHSILLYVDDAPDGGRTLRLKSSTSSDTYGMSHQSGGLYLTTARFGTYALEVSIGGSWLAVSSVSVLGAGGETEVRLYSITVEESGVAGHLRYPALSEAGKEVRFALDEGYRADVSGEVPDGIVPAALVGSCSVYMPHKAVRFIAEVSVITFTVSFDTGDAGISLESKVFGYFDRYSGLHQPARSGYSFGGWFVNGDMSLRAVDGGEIPVKSDHRLVALWVKNDDAEYLVRIFLQDTEGQYALCETITRTGTIGTSVGLTESDTSRAGFDFNAKKSTTSGTVSGSRDTVLEAYFDRQKYTVSVTIYYPGGWVPSSGFHDYEKIFYGAALDFIQVEEGFSIVSVYSDADKTKAVVSVPPSDDDRKVSLYAVAEYILYTIDYNPNDGEMGSDPILRYVISKEAIYLPEPCRDGFIFNGWKGIGEELLKAIPSETTGNLTLIANWTRLPLIAVSDDVNVGGADSLPSGQYRPGSIGAEVVFRYDGEYTVYKWMVNGVPCEPTGPNELKMKVTEDVSVWPYFVLKDNTVAVEFISATLYFIQSSGGSYESDPGVLGPVSFGPVSLSGYGFSGGTISAVEGKLVLNGLGDVSGILRIPFLLIDGDSGRYILDLTVKIVPKLEDSGID